MPHLTLCNRALPFGSDDFTFCWNCPTYVYHTLWFGLLLGAWFPYHSLETIEILDQKIYDQGKLTTSNQQMCIQQARVWLTGSVCFFSLSFVVAVATNCVSARGPIFMEPFKKNIRDCWVRLLISLQALLGLMEFGWGVTGVIVYSVSLHDPDGAGHACLKLMPLGSDLLLAACIFVLSRRVVSLCFFCGCLLSGSEQINQQWLDAATRNPMRRTDSSGALSNDTKTQSLLDGEYDMNEEDERALEEIRKKYRRKMYTKRCRNLCRCFCVDDEGAFEDIGRLLSDFFVDFDVVSSDMAAMLYAVHLDQHRQQQRVNRQRKKAMEETTESHDGKVVRYAHECIDRPRFGEHPQDKKLLCRITDNVRFAYGAYGWMLHTYDGLSTCGGCRLLCCDGNHPCCHCCTTDIHAKQADSCCPGLKRCHGYNTAAMVELSGIEQDGVVYVSWKNDAKNYSPYALMVDHRTKQVVVACRGTLSLSDCLTDALADDMHLEEMGKEFGFQGKNQFGHTGIFEKGQNIARHLEQLGYLRRLLRKGDGVVGGNSKQVGGGGEGRGGDAVVVPPHSNQAWVDALPDCSGYELLVTGHSLGGGLATVVSLLLKAKYPELVCFAYSPPGGMLTLPLALQTRSYIFSLVVGDDMVSRLGLRSIFALREAMFDMVPKMKHINKQSMLWRIMIGADVEELEWDAERGGVAEEKKEHHTNDDEATGAGKDTGKDTGKDAGAGKDTSAPSADRTRVPTSIRRMYPPGWLLHLRQVCETRPCLDTCCCNGCCCMSAIMGVGTRELVPVWLNQDGLQEIRVSRTMASDHFPDRVVAALRQIRPTDEEANVGSLATEAV